jgi:hypothetical protein
MVTLKPLREIVQWQYKIYFNFKKIQMAQLTRSNSKEHQRVENAELSLIRILFNPNDD